MILLNHYLPGAIGAITGLHAGYYSKHWGFGLYFEAKVARELSEFLMRFDPNSDGIWLLVENEKIYGSVVIDGIHHREEGAHLRWFIVDQSLWGRGYGRELLGKAVGFSKEKGYQKIYLWTFEGLNRARHLYDSFGFVVAREQIGDQWGKEVKEQMMVKSLA